MKWWTTLERQTRTFRLACLTWWRRSKGERQDSGGASANDVKVINTSAFINTKIDYGLYFVFHLMDSVTLTIISLIDNGVSGFAWGADACPCLPLFGWRPVDPLSSDQLAGKTGKQNIYCYIKSFQPRCWPTPVFRASKVDKPISMTASLCRALTSKKGTGFQQEEDTNSQHIAWTPSETYDPIIFW